MIEYISGQVVDLTPTSVILECNGIGYFLNISLTTYSSLSSKNSGKLYVYEAIREDAYILYGFLDRRERELFLLLISVSGVGPNTARMILSSLTPPELEQVIASGNVNMLKGVRGGDTLNISTPSNSEVQEEALAALVMLGFSQIQSQKAIQKLLKESPLMTVEEVIKAALKMM